MDYQIIIAFDVATNYRFWMAGNTGDDSEMLLYETLIDKVRINPNKKQLVVLEGESCYQDEDNRTLNLPSADKIKVIDKSYGHSSTDDLFSVERLSYTYKNALVVPIHEPKMLDLAGKVKTSKNLYKLLRRKQK